MTRIKLQLNPTQDSARDVIWRMFKIAAMVVILDMGLVQENLSSGFPTKRFST